MIGERAVRKEVDEDGLAGEEVGVEKEGRGWVNLFGDEGLLDEREDVEDEAEGWVLSLTGEEGMGVDEVVTSSRYRLGGALILLGRSSLVSGRDRSVERSWPSRSSPFEPTTSSTFTSCSSSFSSPSSGCFLETTFPVG